jgi:ribosomal protein S18 acetylase RimI-like enzyme
MSPAKDETSNPSHGVPVREYDAGKDERSLRDCIVELQDFERALIPALPEGAMMADGYLAELTARCARSKGAIFVADAGTSLVGFVCVLAAVRQEELDEPPGAYAYITDLMVRNTHRRRGLGEALLRRALAFAASAGATSIKIGVLSKNVEAQRLYERAGFTPYRVELSRSLETPSGR